MGYMITFSKNPIYKLQVLWWNKYEIFTHWYWNRKPYHVTCQICGKTITSKEKDSPSPEECGWRNLKGGKAWICHQCDAHRFFKPYVELTDLDEHIEAIKGGWNGSHESLDDLVKHRKEILDKLKEEYD